MANRMRRLGWDIADIVECHGNYTSNYTVHYSVLNLVAHAVLVGRRNCGQWELLGRTLQRDVRFAVLLCYHSRNLL